MLQINEYVNVNAKINDKILHIEERTHRKFTDKERKIAWEMFMSGFLFASQWRGDELLPIEHKN